MSIFHRVLNVFRGERLSDDIRRELSFHIRERADELIAGGMSERAAYALARRQFGNPTFQAESTRESDIVRWIDSVRGDLRYALRALRHSPVFTAVAITSLALGVGANSAIYTLIDSVMVRSLPVPHPEQLVGITYQDGGEVAYWTNPIWEAVRDRQNGFSSMAAMSETSWNIADGGEVRAVRGLWASGGFFTLFGMRPAAGRLFTTADDVRGCPAMVVLGYGFWQSEYGGRADAVGKTIAIAGKPFEIIGVAGPGFSGPEVGRESQIYAPLCSEAVVRGASSALDRRSNWWLRIVGRLDEGVSLQQARARLKTIAPAVFAATIPPNWATSERQEYTTRSLSATEVSQGMSEVRTRYATALKVIMGAVALVLLIACANVANLLLARAAARQREVAIRMAIGAGRQRLVRQLLTESALLAGAGALGGLVLAHWGTRGLVGLISTPGSPVALDLGLNWRILAFTVFVATMTALLFGLVPAWRGTRVDPQSAMRAHGRGVVEGVGTGRFTLGKALVAAQVALSLTLLVGAGLLIGTLANLRRIDPGFNSDGVLLASVNLTRAGIPAEQRLVARRALLQGVRAIPGVRSAATSNLTPIGNSSWNDAIYVDGFTPKNDQDNVVWFNEVSAGYFTTMRTKLLAGRDFDDTDTPVSPKVAIVDEATAKKYFAGSPIGKQYRIKEGDSFLPAFTVVGVVQDAKYQRLRETNSMTIYVAESQASPRNQMNIEVRVAGSDARVVVAPLKALITSAHPLASIELRTLSDQIATSLNRDRVLAVLSGLFGGVALLLSMLGLYGVMAYTVARRRNEIGVRIALGAASGRVVRMVLGDVGRVVTVGVVVGLIGATVAGKLVTAFLYGIAPGDPTVLAGATALLAAIALLAGLIPSLRAATVNPVAALRED